MITQGEYDRVPERDWIGKAVRSLRPMKNGWAELPAGTLFTIRGKHGGFELVSEPCPCCGIKVHMSKVRCDSLERA